MPSMVACWVALLPRAMFVPVSGALKLYVRCLQAG